MNEKRKKFDGVYLIIPIILLLTYLPVLLPYAYHDEFCFFQRPAGRFAWHPIASWTTLLQGRPGVGLLFTLNGLLVQDLQGLILVRLLLLFQIIAAAYLCLPWLDKITGDRARSLLLSIMVFTLPPFMVAVSWSGCVLSPTVLLSIAAAYFAGKISPGKWHGAASGRFWLAVLFFLLANLTYPSAAVFYWVLVFTLCVEQLRKPNAQRMDPVLPAVMAGIVTYGIYAVLLKIMHWIAVANHLEHAFPSFYNPLHMELDAARKIIWFFREPFFNAVNLWNIFPDWVLPLFLIAIAGISCGIFLMKRGWRDLCFIVGVAGAFLFLSFTPNLIAGVDAPFYRCLTGLGPLVLLITYLLLSYVFRVNGWDRSLMMVLFAGTIAGSITANQTVLNYRALPSLTETRYLAQQFERIPLKQDNHLHYSGMYADPAFSRYDEFGTYTLNFADDLTGIPVCFMRMKARKEGYLLDGVRNSEGSPLPHPQIVSFYWRHPDYPKITFESDAYVTTLLPLASGRPFPTLHINLTDYAWQNK